MFYKLITLHQRVAELDRVTLFLTLHVSKLIKPRHSVLLQGVSLKLSVATKRSHFPTYSQLWRAHTNAKFCAGLTYVDKLALKCVIYMFSRDFMNLYWSYWFKFVLQKNVHIGILGHLSSWMCINLFSFNT